MICLCVCFYQLVYPCEHTRGCGRTGRVKGLGVRRKKSAVNISSTKSDINNKSQQLIESHYFGIFIFFFLFLTLNSSSSSSFFPARKIISSYLFFLRLAAWCSTQSVVDFLLRLPFVFLLFGCLVVFRLRLCSLFFVILFGTPNCVGAN